MHGLIENERPDLFGLNCELEGVAQELTFISSMESGVELTSEQWGQVFHSFAEHIWRICKDIEYIEKNYDLVVSKRGQEVHHE